jgi:pectinesterase
VYPGVYKEKVTVDKDNITLKGSSFPSTDAAQNGASIEAANYATDTDDDSGS